jgi:hypothetical protein
MDLADDEHIKQLAARIQRETDRDKVVELAQELCRLVDAKRDGKPQDSKH